MKQGTPGHGITEHGTPADHWTNTGTLAEQRNTSRSIGIPWNSGT